MTTRDDELLDVLAASLGPAPDVEPTWAEISQLHRVIDSGYASRRPGRPPLWRIRRPLTAAMAGFLVLGGASAAAAMSGAVMPQPVRVAARAVGLPVESPELADARTALAGLRASLGQQHLDAVRARAQEVRDRLGRLSADDRSHVEDEAAFLLAEADAALAPPPVVLGSLPPQAPAGSSGATPVAAAPSAPAAVDDHGRAEPADDRNQGRGSDDHPSGTSDDHSGSVNTGSGSSGPGPSGSSGGSDDHTATTQHVDNSGPGSSDGGGGGGSDGGSSHGGSSDGGGGSSGSDGGGHSGPG